MKEYLRRLNIYKLTKDGYYIYEDHNINIPETDLQNCKNDKIDVDKIRKERTELLKKVHGFLGIKDFMKFVYLIDSCPYNFYTNDDNEYEKPENCDCYHCCECWDRVIREKIIKGD